MRQHATIVEIKSLSYTGTTWLNMVVGSHPRAMGLGPADRLWRIARGEQSGDACLVHGADCPFWPEFLRQYSPDKNLFLELAKFSGKTHFVTNNLIAAGAGTQREHPDVSVIQLRLVRDGRALAASHNRKFPEKSFFESIVGWLLPPFRRFEFDKSNPDYLCLRYEDLIQEPSTALHEIGRIVGLDYSEDALAFWKWGHHPVSGNVGTIALLKLSEGLKITQFKGADFYTEQFAKLGLSWPPTFLDTRADQSLHPRDRFFFDALCGADNARFGYARDLFDTSQVAEYLPMLRRAVSGGLVPRHSRDLVQDALKQFAP